MKKNIKTTTTQKIFNLLLALFMIYAGVSHLTFNRIDFQAQVPDWVPLSKEVVVIFSGIVEITLGLGLALWKNQRVRFGWALAFFFILVFPGNIAQYLDGKDAFGALDSDRARLIRLFFQPILIAWALWSSGAWQSWTTSKKKFNQKTTIDMKVLQIIKYGELKDGLSFSETTRPSINATDILIETKAAGLNPIDYKLVSGNLKDMVPLDLPSTIGFDVSGTIIKKGKDVTRFEVGDAVYARVPQNQMGTVAEYVTVNSTVVSKKPENISFEEAVGLPLIGLTSIQALERVGLKEGDRVLIHAGSGGVGSFAIQYAKTKGAYVYTTTSTTNVEWVKALGADRVIDYKKEDYKTIVSDLDIVFDTLGDDYTLEAFQIIKEGGKVTSIASVPDEETAAMMGIKDYKLPEKFSKLIDAKSANYKLTWMQPNGEQLDAISAMVKNEKIKPITDKVYSFEDGIEAYLYLATGRAKGKVIINFS